MDGRKSSSSCCSSITLVVFVAVCLVGVWMLTSSSAVPSFLSGRDTESDVQDQVSQSGQEFGKMPEDNSDEVTKVDEHNEVKNEETDFGDSQEQSVTDERKEQDDATPTDSKKEEEQGDAEQTDNQEKSEPPVEKIEEESVTEDKEKTPVSVDVFPDSAQSELLNDTDTQNGAFPTQALESTKEKEVQKSSAKSQFIKYDWKLCNVSSGPDYIPCLDNLVALRKLRSTKHYEHRERHCPEEGPSCLVPLPEGYKQPIKWPQSRDKV